MSGPFAMGFGTQEASGNIKLASARPNGRKVFATYRPVGASCPQACPMLGDGCYAQSGNVNMHQRTSGAMSFNVKAWAKTLPAGALVRWNVSGDVVGTDGATYRAGITASHRARPDLAGWLYTHAWADPAVSAWAVRLPAGVRAVASVDSAPEVGAAHSAGFRTIAAVAPGTPDGHWDAQTARGARDTWQSVARAAGLPLVVCPAQRKDKAPVGCADCTACMRDGLILFAAHGSGTKRVVKRLSVVS